MDTIRIDQVKELIEQTEASTPMKLKLKLLSKLEEIERS